MPSESVKSLINQAPDRPGVYRFLDISDRVIYVGKAKSLIKRLKSYLAGDRLSSKTAMMVHNAERVIWDETTTEIEALLLEAKLIKEYSPRYNILLKDDKSYPFLRITKDKFPKVEKYRGVFNKKDYLIGPFTTPKSVDSIISLVSQIFQIRTCSNVYFANRKRPCLRHFIHRCTAPCVGLIGDEEYSKSVASAKSFLKGENSGLVKSLTNQMHQASREQNYELAAVYRNRIQFLEDLFSNNKGLVSTHIITVATQDDLLCMRVSTYENNVNLGSKEFIFKNQDDSAAESFLTQFYYNNKVPKEVLLGFEVRDPELFNQAYKSNFHVPQKGFKRDLVDRSIAMTADYLNDYISKNKSYKKIIESIKETFHLKKLPIRIETYDNTHMHGAHSYGGVVVYNNGEFIRNEYRLYKIEESNSDDYFMLRTVIQRRFTDNDNPPDLLLIDGGIGQFNTVIAALKDVNQDIDVICIAKGANRNAFDETFFSKEVRNFKFNKSDPILFFFERLRDEAHKHVISANRYAFKRDIKRSIINEIGGVGNVKKKALLNKFGSLECIRKASMDELASVEGVGPELAERIYKFFHG